MSRRTRLASLSAAAVALISTLPIAAGQGIKPPVGAALGAAWYLIAPDGSVILEKPPQR